MSYSYKCCAGLGACIRLKQWQSRMLMSKTAASRTAGAGPLGHYTFPSTTTPRTATIILLTGRCTSQCRSSTPKKQSGLRRWKNTHFAATSEGYLVSGELLETSVYCMPVNYII